MFRHAVRRTVPAAALALGFLLATPRDADALTISLDFVSGTTIDLFGVATTPADYSGFGYTGLTTTQIQAGILTAVTHDYLGFPSMGVDAASPLPVGRELNINFVMASSATAPSNGDTEYYHVAIGTKIGAHDFLGQACLSCVRDEFGNGPGFGVTNGRIVGSILVDNIAALAALATTDAQRINLLAGTISHEIGHLLSLPHPGTALPNPGQSIFSLMATGASPPAMPNNQRVLDRDFAYTEFDQLIGAVGLRDTSPVPEPATLTLLALGSLLIALRTGRRAPVSG